MSLLYQPRFFAVVVNRFQIFERRRHHRNNRSHQDLLTADNALLYVMKVGLTKHKYMSGVPDLLYAPQPPGNV